MLRFFHLISGILNQNPYQGCYTPKKTSVSNNKAQTAPTAIYYIDTLIISPLLQLFFGHIFQLFY